MFWHNPGGGAPSLWDVGSAYVASKDQLVSCSCPRLGERASRSEQLMNVDCHLRDASQRMGLSAVPSHLPWRNVRTRHQILEGTRTRQRLSRGCLRPTCSGPLNLKPSICQERSQGFFRLNLSLRQPEQRTEAESVSFLLRTSSVIGRASITSRGCVKIFPPSPRGKGLNNLPRNRFSFASRRQPHLHPR